MATAAPNVTVSVTDACATEVSVGNVTFLLPHVLDVRGKRLCQWPFMPPACVESYYAEYSTAYKVVCALYGVSGCFLLLAALVRFYQVVAFRRKSRLRQERGGPLALSKRDTATARDSSSSACDAELAGRAGSSGVGSASALQGAADRHEAGRTASEVPPPPPSWCRDACALLAAGWGMQRRSRLWKFVGPLANGMSMRSLLLQLQILTALEFIHLMFDPLSLLPCRAGHMSAADRILLRYTLLSSLVWTR